LLSPRLDRMVAIRRSIGGIVSSALVVAAVSACSGSAATPTPSPITDPNQVLAQSLLNLERSRSFHVAGTIGGSVDMNSLSQLSGSSLGLSGKLDLKGGTIFGDVDTAAQAVHVMVAFPSLFGLSIDLIEVDGYSYTKINLMSDKYSKSRTDVSAVSSAIPGPSLRLSDAVDQIRQVLGNSGATSALVGHSKVDGRDAYELSLSISADALNAAAGSFVPGLAGYPSLDSASAEYWAYSDALLPAQLQLKAASTSLGNLDVSVTLTRYDKAVSIAAPPADQVEGQ
jgi:hypothetical protein